jgi:RNA polymerase sigma factor (sigma-70 family)
MMTQDMELAREYAVRGCEEAFATLVSRYINLVYSIAFRRLGDAHLAEEVTQATFVILARKAGSLGPDTVLSAWLCRTAQYVSARASRNERRRRNREQEMYMQSLSNASGPETSPWPEIAPLLDIAMAHLREKDHSAIVLRFFEGKDLKQVGAALGVNENTAKTRVSRAVEKLRKFFVRRGVMVPAAVLAAAISSNSVQAAPVTLAKSVTDIAIAKGAAAGGSVLTLIQETSKLMAWTKARTAVIIGGCLLLVAGTTAIGVSNFMDQSIREMPADWSVLSGNPNLFGLLERTGSSSPRESARNSTPNPWHWANGRITLHDDFGESLLLSGKEYGDFTMSVIASANTRDASLAIRMQDITHGYIIAFCPAGTRWSAHNPAHLDVVKRSPEGNAYDKLLATYKGKEFDAVGRKAKIDVSAHGPLIEVRLNGAKVLEVNDDTYLSGRIGFRTGDPPFPCEATYSKLTIH